MIATSRFDPNGSLKLELKFEIGELSKYDYNIGIRRYAELTAKEIEELRKKNIKELDVTNYDSPYVMGSGVIISAK